MKKIYHIPHSSTYIPEKYLSEYNVSKEELETFSTILSDIKTNEMVDEKDAIIFPYSRLFCDVERFNYDKEEMNKIGMGILYKVNHNLDLIREEPSLEIIDFYNEHHTKLNNITKLYLEKYGEVLFIDLHSYSKNTLPYELNKDSERPEICIGINDNFQNIKLLNDIINKIRDFGFTYSINSPFSGCLVPSDYIDDSRVYGIMIEIRKDTYENEDGFNRIKSLLNSL